MAVTAMAFKASTTHRQGIVFLLLVGLLTIRSEAIQTLVCRGEDSPLLADALVCSNLVDSLQGSSRVIPEGQQAICRVLRRGQCCVTWASPATGVTENDLYQSASKVLNRCQNNGTVAGFELFVDLNGTKTTQCLSNSSNPADC